MGKISSAISVENLSFSYNENRVFEHASIDIARNKFTVILGRNGCGKSTLLRIIAGLQNFSEGKILFKNTELKSINLRKRASVFGFLSQQHKAIFPFTVDDVVLTGRAGYVSYTPTRHDKDKASAAIEKTGISYLKGRLYTEISGGEQQLVMIARVLAQEPEILLFDEPTSHLDFCNQANILNLLKKLAGERFTVVAVLHDPNSAFLYGDDFIFIKDKKLLRTVAPVKPWDVEFLRSVYQSPINSIPYLDRALIVPSIDHQL